MRGVPIALPLASVSLKRFAWIQVAGCPVAPRTLMSLGVPL